MDRFARLVPAIFLVVCIGLLLPYGPLVDTAIQAYREFIGDPFAFGDSPPNIEARAKAVPLKDLTEMLTYANPDARAFAAKALGFRGENAAVPSLIRALNDTGPFRDPQTRDETSLAEISKASLIKILRAQIVKEPENIGLLVPLFTAAERGSQSERKSVVEILGEMREPLARPLMLEISPERDAELGKASQTALGQMDALGSENERYTELVGRQVRITLGCALVMALLLWSLFRRVREGTQTRIILLSVLPLALVGSFGAVIISDYSKGEISEQRIDTAIRNRDLISLRTINYHDQTSYPGDSYVTQYLLRRCDEDVVRCLVLLPSVQTTDSEAAADMTETRKRWILARFVASSLGTPRLAELVGNSDVEIRETIVKALGRLNVRNEYVADALIRLSQDTNERVRKIAKESLTRIKGYPVWLGYGPAS